MMLFAIYLINLLYYTNMERSKILLCALLFSTVSYAQADKLYNVQQKQIEVLEQKVQNVKSSNEYLKQENKALKADFSTQKRKIDFLETCIDQNSTNIKNTAKELGIRIKETNANAETKTSIVSQNLESKTLLGIVIAALLLTISILVFTLLRKLINRGTNTLDQIESTQKVLKEESVKLDGKLMDILSTQMKMAQMQPSSQTSTDNHKLVLEIANEVARIEQNLNNMDAKVKGVSNLKNRATAILSTFKSKGYDIPNLLGEPFHEGYNMVATMELDETLPEGIQIIRRVIKPQVNYNGKMIQAAEVVVASNE